MELETRHKIIAFVVFVAIFAALVLFNQEYGKMAWWHWVIVAVFVFAIAISLFF